MSFFQILKKNKQTGPKKVQDGRQNPRWPSKNQFFDIQAPKLKESDRTQRTKKLHWNILNTLKEKIK